MVANIGKLTLPFIVVHGSEDRLVDPGGAKDIYEHAGFTDKTIKIQEGYYHEIHYEPEREFKDLETWLTAHLWVLEIFPTRSSTAYVPQ
jgi:acylglycerol lipase